MLDLLCWDLSSCWDLSARVGGSSLQRSQAECYSLSLEPWGRSETGANHCPCRASPDPGEWAHRNIGLEWCVFIKEVSQFCKVVLLMDMTSLAWKCSWLATEFNVWAGADFQNPIQTTLLPLSFTLHLFTLVHFISTRTTLNTTEFLVLGHDCSHSVYAASLFLIVSLFISFVQLKDLITTHL